MSAMSPTARGSSSSASSIIASTTTGYHILKIDGYSLTTGTPTGEYLKSHPFTLGGHRWLIRYYPNGDSSEVKDYISIFLELDEAVAKVKARYRIRLWEDRVGEEPFKLAPVTSFSSNTKTWGYKKFIKREELEESRHLKDDSFTVRCDIVVVNEFLTVEETAVVPPRFVSVPPSSLHQHLGDLLQSEKGADVVFDVGGQTFAAHRCVLAARSPVFSAELFGTMKESHTTSVILVDDIEVQVFKALLYFVYTDSLPKTKKTEEDEKEGEDEDGEEDEDKDDEEDEKQDEDEDDEEDVMSQHLLVAADRYNLERLKLICEENLCRYINVDTVATILTLTEQHHCEGLKKACFYFVNTPANLRAAMATESFKHLSRSCPAIMEELIAMLVN